MSFFGWFYECVYISLSNSFYVLLSPRWLGATEATLIQISQFSLLPSFGQHTLSCYMLGTPKNQFLRGCVLYYRHRWQKINISIKVNGYPEISFFLKGSRHQYKTFLLCKMYPQTPWSLVIQVLIYFYCNNVTLQWEDTRITRDRIHVA